MAQIGKLSSVRRAWSFPFDMDTMPVIVGTACQKAKTQIRVLKRMPCEGYWMIWYLSKPSGIEVFCTSWRCEGPWICAEAAGHHPRLCPGHSHLHNHCNHPPLHIPSCLQCRHWAAGPNSPMSRQPTIIQYFTHLEIGQQRLQDYNSDTIILIDFWL